MAGESARELARMQREKASRLLASTERYEQGADGEDVTGVVLAGLPAGWTVFDDVAWPGRPRANIDHVVLGPPGIFVIDSKNWTGSVSVKNGVLRQNGYSRQKATDAAISAADAVATLSAEVDRSRVEPVICLMGQNALQTRVGAVVVCSTSTLLAELVSRPAVLEPDRLRAIAADLHAVVRPAVNRTVDTTKRAPSTARRSSNRGSDDAAGVARLIVALLLILAFILFHAQVVDVVDWATTLLSNRLAPDVS